MAPTNAGNAANKKVNMHKLEWMNIDEGILINIKESPWIDVQITHSESCFIPTQNQIRQMCNEGSKGSRFFSTHFYFDD